MLQQYLSFRPNLITLQLSENAQNIATFGKDFAELVEEIRRSVPDAELILIGDFWNEEKSKIKRKLAESLNIPFVDLSRISDVKYMCQLGSYVWGDDGKVHEVYHEGVSMHPGDNAMEYIAKAIIHCIEV